LPDLDPAPSQPPLTLERVLPGVVGVVLHLVAGVWAGFSALVAFVVIGDVSETGPYAAFVVFVVPALWIVAFVAVLWATLVARTGHAWRVALGAPVAFLIVFYVLAVLTLLREGWS
jgi:hypothetical protein